MQVVTLVSIQRRMGASAMSLPFILDDGANGALDAPQVIPLGSALPTDADFVFPSFSVRD